MLLRHRATATGLHTDQGGWASYRDILAISWIREAGVNEVTLDDLAVNRIGAPETAGRYQARHRDGESFLRATYGHTMDHICLDAVGTRLTPEDIRRFPVVYYAVPWEAWQSGIFRKGLVPGGHARSKHTAVICSTDPEHWSRRRRSHPAGEDGEVVVIALDMMRLRRLALDVFWSAYGDVMVAGVVPVDAWL